MSTDSLTALRTIYGNRGGTCSDYSQVFTGLCIAAGIRVREWGVSDNLLRSKIGHAFNEVFVADHAEWMFIDVYRSIYARHPETLVPLSVSEMIDLSSTQQEDLIEIQYIDPARNGRESFPHAQLYKNPNNVFFMLSNYHLFLQDRFLRWSDKVPLACLHLAMFLIGIYQRDEIYTNRQTLEPMKRLVRQLRRGVFFVGSNSPV